jgi:predicted Ser/Thr protein kinase
MERHVGSADPKCTGPARGDPASGEIRPHPGPGSDARGRSASSTIATPDQGATATFTPTASPPGIAPADSGPGPDATGAGHPGRIGKYPVVATLGSGSQGMVYRAVHPALGQDVVIKLARSPMRWDPAGRDGLAAEGRLLAGLDHPGLVRVVDLDFHEDRPFLVMEYVAGRTLGQYAEQHRITPRRAAAIVACAARAAAAAHRRGVVHQDIKPANILIDGAERPRLIDFGMARLRDAWGEGPHGFGGTPCYIAPEQARSEIGRVGPRSDVFALGAVLYELLVGRPPFHGVDTRSTLDRARRCDFDRDAIRAAGVPARLARVCLRAMAAAPEDRHDSADELAAKLERCARGSRGRAPVAALAVALLGLGGACWWFAAGRRDRPVPPVTPIPTDAGRGTLREGAASVGHSSTGTPKPATPELAPLRVLSMEVEDFRFDAQRQRSESLGFIGSSSFAAHYGEEVQVTATLSEPAHCYLIAFNPDGRWQLCYPPNAAGKPDETVRPDSQATIRYPKRETRYFSLTDGRGQEAFVLLASREPLPPFAEWAPRLAGAPWVRARQGGVWTFRDGEIYPAHPSGVARRGQETDRRPEAFEALCRFLAERAKSDAISAIAFPVD